MELDGMSELDLNGVLFINFPDSIPLEECRERLELGIAEAYESLCHGSEDDENPKLCISPYLCYLAILDRANRYFRKLSVEDRRRWLTMCWEERRKNFKMIENRPDVGLTNLKGK